MTAPSQGLNQTEQQQTAGNPEALKAAERSSSPSSVTSRSSAAISMSDQTRCIAVSVE